jgi:ketosteroid isomerase-like protein
MKMRLLLALLSLAIVFAVAAFAQQKDTGDPQIVKQRDLLGVAKALDEFGDFGLKLDQAFNQNNASAVAALFTEDAVLIAPDGLFYGRQVIEKRYANIFQRWPITTLSEQRNQLNAIDNAVWSAGEWWSTLQGEAGPKFEGGYWSAIYVRDGNAWKIRMLSIIEHPIPRAESK